MAYADEVAALVTKAEDFDLIQQSVTHFERATRARLNKQKSKALAILNWTAPAAVLGIDF